MKQKNKAIVYKIECEGKVYICICKKTNKKIGEFKTSVQLSKLLQISHYQAEHYLRGKTKKALELYRFINKEFV